MFNLGITVLAFALYFSFRLRYRIEVKGIDRIRQRSGEGIVFLASYSSTLDPIFVTSLLIMDGMDVRLVAYENEYRRPIVGTIIRWLRGIPVPDLSSSANFLKKQRSELAFRKIAHALKMGDVFLIHPSGRAKTTGKESLKGTKWAHRLVQEVPGLRVVLVRVSGLWGSRFSAIWEHKSPSVFRELWEGIKCIIRNGVFFCPKRQVVITFEENSDSLRDLSRLQFNRYVENWFNQYEHRSQKEGETEETPTFVPYWIFSDPITPSKETPSDAFCKFSNIPAGIVEPILQELTRVTQRNAEDFSPEEDFLEHIGLDAEQRADLLSWVHKRFGKLGLRDHHMSTLQHLLFSVKQGVELEKERSGYYRDNFQLKDWFKECERIPITAPVGTLLQEAFLRSCDRGGSATACADFHEGVCSYKELKRRALLFAKELKYLPGDRVGIMLPSSIDATIILFATLLAGKIPVMMDWTTDRKTIREAVELSDVHVVFTSRWFSDEVTHGSMDHISHLLFMIEDIQERASFWEKIKSHLEGLRSADKLLDEWDEYCSKPSDIAGIFFKRSPKGKLLAVPLSHKNILSNVSNLFSALPITSQDSILAVIPPSHIIGFSLLHIFSICCSVRTFYYPHSLENVQISVLVEQLKPSIFIGTPLILQALLEFAHPEELTSIRCFLCCGGSLSEELTQKIESLGSVVIQGYGAAEFGGIVALHQEKASGGFRAVSGTSFSIVHPETGAILTSGVSGQICVCGDSVFSGYLVDKDPKQNFFVDGKKRSWFKTGDFGSLDGSNQLSILSPLSRRVYKEGQWFFLEKLEQQIIAFLETKQKNVSSPNSFTPGPSVVVYRNKKRDAICLATTLDIESEELNIALKTQNNCTLDIIDSVYKISKIPLLESGKVNYFLLEKNL